MLSFIRTNDGFTGIVGSRSFTFNNGHLNYEQLVAILKQSPSQRDEKYFTSLLNIEAAVQRSVNEGTNAGNIEVKNGQVYYRGQPMHNNITERILEMIRDGFDCGYMVKFLENIKQNSSARATNEGFDFLQHKNLPITEDGCFIAYKTVRSDFLDKYSGTISNKVGSVVKFERNAVDDDREQECSYGLHVGALEYAGPGGTYNSPGDIVVQVKVNPKDIVAVPKDYDAQKMRVCEYTVLQIHNGPLTHSVYQANGGEMENRRQVEIPPNNTPTYYNGDQIFEGDEIKFEYEKATGEVSTRYLAVDKKTNTHFTGVLLHPEIDAGHTRTFLREGITKIQLMGN